METGRVDGDLAVQLQPDQEQPKKQDIAINGVRSPLLSQLKFKMLLKSLSILMED
ncbi:MAG: hypothetical protein HC773_32270 [Scytonema sp. CRU_2_7]|nr:hypothetical protein [Scytonema sp. CRU_2_7]